ncbi:hypothetical protein Vretimale_12579 [Volvox reticuliferus]|uniref:Uncharacterized protein n=1 Tax=Volvox reticuliferus TaxID=1737510 RepID=A0A8J4CZ67_9CHLO|nr:hypothetical protein Vretifemale_20153 [Volvox reticuliferus]GIM08560.1 hypothetical protein Vretimale_12579 [Volvox reticuliferus]
MPYVSYYRNVITNFNLQFPQTTTNGLDALLKMQFLQVQSLLTQPTEASSLNSSEFGFIWSTGMTDTEGGMTKISQVFLGSVNGSYSDVVIQQVVMFVIAWVWGAIFLLLQLRPIVRQAQHEMRRVAELLSQLPPEVDCEAMVTAVVLGLEDQPLPGRIGRAATAAAAAAAAATATGGVNGGGGGGGGNSVSIAAGGGGSVVGPGPGGKPGAFTDVGLATFNMVRRKPSLAGLIRTDMIVAKEAD